MADVTLAPLQPTEAIRFFESKGYKVGYHWQDTWQEEHARAFTVAKAMNYDLLELIRQHVDQGLREGVPFEQFRKELTPKLQAAGWWGKQEMADPLTGETQEVQLGSPHRLRIIYNTNLRSARAAGRWEIIQRNKARRPYLRYSAVLDDHTRPEHREWGTAGGQGIILPVDHPFWDTHFPPNGWNCFPAETAVRCDALIGLKAWYAGEMVEIRTAQGHRLTVTANHPVLTSQGWRAAQQIKEGHELLGAAGDVNPRLSGIVDHEQPPASAKELFQSLTTQGLRVVPMTPDDFDGDAAVMEGEIEVAGADGALMDVRQSALGEFLCKSRFDGSNHRTIEASDVALGAPDAPAAIPDAVLSENILNSRLRHTEAKTDNIGAYQAGSIERQDLTLDLHVPVVGGLPGRTTLPLDATGCTSDDLPLGFLGAGAIPEGDAGDLQGTGQSGPAASPLVSELLQANAGAISLDKVVHIRKFEWSGHVYDFVTKTGLIVANGLIVSNCRCSVMQLSERDLQRRGWRVSTEAEVAAFMAKEKSYINKRSGELIKMPRGIDFGFGFNVGKAHMQGLAPPPQSGPLSVPHIQPDPMPPMPPARPMPASTVLPKGEDDDFYIDSFLEAFGAARGKPVVYTDQLNQPLVIDESFFRRPDGSSKLGSSDRKAGLALLAEAIKSPDEIWWSWEKIYLDRERTQFTYRLRRRYIARFTIEDNAAPMIAVLDVGKDGWKGVTGFRAGSENYLENIRGGVFGYRRAE